MNRTRRRRPLTLSSLSLRPCPKNLRSERNPTSPATPMKRRLLHARELLIVQTIISSLIDHRAAALVAAAAVDRRRQRSRSTDRTATLQRACRRFRSFYERGRRFWCKSQRSHLGKKARGLRRILHFLEDTWSICRPWIMSVFRARSHLMKNALD